jgi:hypothetical protein
MRRSFDLSLRLTCLALLFVGVNLSALSAQTRNVMDTQVDLSGKYAGELKFPSAKLSGKTTLNVEGNKFTLRDANGTEKAGRISAVNNLDYVSIALMLEETPGENQPFTHSVMSLRMPKAGKNLILTSAPGESREFLFQAPLTSDAKLVKPVKVKLVNEDCSNSASPNCGVNFGTITDNEFEEAAKPTKVSRTKSKRQRNAAKTEKPIAVKSTTQKDLSENTLKVKSPARNQVQNETPKSQKTAAEQPTLNIQNTATQNQTGETNLSDLNKATEEMRRAMLELRRANDEIKATTDELRRLRTESTAKTSESAGAAKTETAIAASNEKSSVNSSNSSRSKKALKSRKAFNSTKSAAKKPTKTKNNLSKSASLKGKTPTKKSAAAKISTSEKNAKPAEAKPSPAASPSP